MVLDWYLGDSGSVTSPAIDSPTPLVSHSHLVPHLQNKSLMPQLFCPEPVHSPAAGTGASSPPWTTAVCLVTQRWGLSFHWTANEKKSIHVPTLILYFFLKCFFSPVSSSTSSPLLPFLWKTLLEAHWRWSWEAAGFPPWNEDWNTSLALARDAALGSHTAPGKLISRLLQQLPALGEQHAWAGHPWRGRDERRTDTAPASGCPPVLVYCFLREQLN